MGLYFYRRCALGVAVYADLLYDSMRIQNAVRTAENRPDPATFKVMRISSHPVTSVLATPVSLGLQTLSLHARVGYWRLGLGVAAFWRLLMPSMFFPMHYLI